MRKLQIYPHIPKFVISNFDLITILTSKYKSILYWKSLEFYVKSVHIYRQSTYVNSERKQVKPKYVKHKCVKL